MTTLTLLIFANLIAALNLAPAAGREAAASGATESALLKGPALDISKTCPKLRYVGRDATFEIVVTNRGDGPAANVVVTDAVPTGVEFLSADSDGKREGNNVVWRIASLDAGQSRTLKVNVKCNQITTVKNTATVTWCAEATATCEFPVQGVPAVLLECVDDPDPIEVGGQVTYTIAVTNQGTAMDSNVRLVCTLPPELEFVKCGGATEAKADGATVKFAPLASLAPKARAEWKLTAKGVKTGDVRFRVEMQTDQIGTTPVMETESTHVY